MPLDVKVNGVRPVTYLTRKSVFPILNYLNYLNYLFQYCQAHLDNYSIFVCSFSMTVNRVVAVIILVILEITLQLMWVA